MMAMVDGNGYGDGHGEWEEQFVFLSSCTLLQHHLAPLENFVINKRKTWNFMSLSIDLGIFYETCTLCSPDSFPS